MDSVFLKENRLFSRLRRKYQSIIFIIKMKLEEHICKNVIFSLLATNSYKRILLRYCIDLIFVRFKEFSNWLEYNIEKEVIFYLSCYLFRPDIGK